jgi:hypothetical protein
MPADAFEPQSLTCERELAIHQIPPAKRCPFPVPNTNASDLRMLFFGCSEWLHLSPTLSSGSHVSCLVHQSAGRKRSVLHAALRLEDPRPTHPA